MFRNVFKPRIIVSEHSQSKQDTQWTRVLLQQLCVFNQKELVDVDRNE